MQRLRYRWVIFALVSCNGAILYFHYVWSATLSSFHTVDWNLNASQLGLLAALGFFPYALMQIPGGYLTDRFGVRRVLGASVGVLAVGTALFASSPNYGLAVVSRTLIGFSSGVIMLPALKVLAQWFRVREFATIQGGYILLSNIGSVMGTLPLALAAERWGWRAPMIAAAVFTLLVALATFLFLRNTPADLGLPPLSAIDPDAPPEESGARLPSLRFGLRAWLSIPTLWAISVIFFAAFGALQSFQALWAGPLLRHVRGLSVAETGAVLFTFTIGSGIGPVVFGFISDRLAKARKPVLIVAAWGQVALWVLVILSFERVPLPLLYVVFVALSAFSGGTLVGQVIIKELSPPYLFGTIYGIHNGSGFYGTAVLQLITGSILSAIGPVRVAGEPIYSAQAYALALSPILVFILLAAVLSFRLRETLGPRRVAWPAHLS
jgi:sugar phosphate permease